MDTRELIGVASIIEVEPAERAPVSVQVDAMTVGSFRHADVLEIVHPLERAMVDGFGMTKDVVVGHGGSLPGGCDSARRVASPDA